MLTKREESWAQACSAIVEICRDVKARQTMFLAQNGHTWESARALPKYKQDALQRLWELRK